MIRHALLTAAGLEKTIAIESGTSPAGRDDRGGDDPEAPVHSEVRSEVHAIVDELDGPRQRRHATAPA